MMICDWCDRPAVHSKLVWGTDEGDFAGAMKIRACEEHEHLLDPQKRKRRPSVKIVRERLFIA